MQDPPPPYGKRILEPCLSQSLFRCGSNRDFQPGEEHASRLNLHLVTGSTDPHMLFLIIYCYLDTFWILYLTPMVFQDLALLQAKRVPFYLIHRT